jgi:predicted RecA/RadA family phage recombinase
MKNYVQSAMSFDFVAPVGGVVSGTPVLLGSLLVIPVGDAAVGEKFAGMLEGIYTLAAATADTPAQGTLAYWDDTAKEVTTDDDTGNNPLCGWFVEAKSAGVTSAKVKLTGAVA